MDGVSIGMMVDKVQKEGNLFVPIQSDNILDAPEYKERMYIKTKKNRKMLRTACEERKYQTNSLQSRPWYEECESVSVLSHCERSEQFCERSEQAPCRG